MFTILPPSRLTVGLLKAVEALKAGKLSGAESITSRAQMAA
jgi:hypothetical protein